eukprot:m.11913 g.11913  ORF g.11913 m.11913 type:complete len:300 (+) comp5999_c0_seq1:88-987(+)
MNYPLTLMGKNTFSTQTSKILHRHIAFTRLSTLLRTVPRVDDCHALSHHAVEAGQVLCRRLLLAGQLSVAVSEGGTRPQAVRAETQALAGEEVLVHLESRHADFLGLQLEELDPDGVAAAQVGHNAGKRLERRCGHAVNLLDDGAFEAAELSRRPALGRRDEHAAPPRTPDPAVHGGGRLQHRARPEDQVVCAQRLVVDKVHRVHGDFQHLAVAVDLDYDALLVLDDAGDVATRQNPLAIDAQQHVAVLQLRVCRGAVPALAHDERLPPASLRLCQPLQLFGRLPVHAHVPHLGEPQVF